MATTAFTGSNLHWQRHAQDVIAQGALTNSKRPQSFVFPVYPTHVKRGENSYLWDMEGKRYLDFICGLGTNILGYAHPMVNQAIVGALQDGLSLSLSSGLELDFAEKLKELFPFVQSMKMLKTGTEACMAAVKIARAATGRAAVLSEGYHGWSDDFVYLTDPALGVPNKKLYARPVFPFEIDRIDSSVAAVIVEPVITDNSSGRLELLKRIRERCTKHGVILIFDEVITGFRYLGYSVSREHGIEPDLICLGKAIANGMPLSVVAGSTKLMNCGEYFVSSTFAGERASLAAGIETMRLLQTKYRISDLWSQGTRFQNEFNSIWPGKFKIEGYPTRGVFKGDDMVKALFFQEACRAGLLFGSSFFFNFAHIEHIESVISVSKDILGRIKSGSVKLLGEPPVSPFAQKVRDK